MAPTLFDAAAKPGDLIEISRAMYNHWAIYIGGNEVVHLTTSSSNSGPFGDLMVVLDSGSARVRRQKLWEVTGTDDFEINNLLDDEVEPRERHVIVREACELVGKELPYSVTTSNCEHFVTQLRYGKPESRQVKMAAVIGGGAAIAGIGIIALGAFVATLFKDDDDKEEERPQRHERHHHHQRRYRHK